MQIADRCVVSIHYTLTTDDSADPVDSSAGHDPLVYLHGFGNLIPGLERELAGRRAGDAFRASIQPADGYGEHDPDLVQDVPLEMLANIDGLHAGMMLQSQDSSGHVRDVVVEAVGTETARLNANHALAGKVLHFDVEVAAVRAATDEEVAHGHVHGPGHAH